MRNILIALLSIMLIPLVAAAETADRPNTILVLDASGSMWGQIDGVNKIVIARDVIAEMLADMPDDAALGLTVYGHRERGNCADIETLIAPAPFTQDAIMAAVNAINPRGRTPMTAAVVEAARALRSTEEAATVILVSDGIETCEADPCAIAAELEAAGIAFTAHVVGFDVADPAARAQMQCIADNTGGMFLTANNAEELASALEQVVMAPAAPPPPPLVVEVTFTARIGGAEGPLITDPVLWDIAPLPENVTADTEGNPLVYDMGTGSYTVTAYWTVQEVAETVQFVITDAPREIAVIFAAPLPQASITAPATAAAGATLEIGWTGPNYAGDFIGVGMANAEGGARWQNYTRTADGSPLMLEMPAEPGQYLIRYFIDQDRQIIAEVQITLTEVLASITAPATAAAGATLEIGWTGPNYAGDFIGVGMANAEGGSRWQNYTRTADGSPLMLEMPAEPGQYLIRYFIDQDRQIIAEVPITLTEVLASITAPATAAAGATLEIGWTGPNYRGDFIGVGMANAEGGARWQNYTRTTDGSPLMLEMPAEPGQYLIRYFIDQDRQIIAEVPITLTEVLASITAPATAAAGATLEIGWTGPNYRGDFIGVGMANAEGGARWQNYTRTADGSPLMLEMPAEPGQYLIRYFIDQDRQIIAEVPITLTEVLASITAPATAAAGATLEIGWTGPNYAGDFIGVGMANAEGGARWQNYTRTADGSPLMLEMPAEPGQYLIRYFIDQDRQIIAEVPITLTEVTATLNAPDIVKLGETITITWTGPNYRGDYIGIGRADAEGGARWQDYERTENGSPLMMDAPDEPGAYVIRYFIDQDNRVIASRPLMVQQ